MQSWHRTTIALALVAAASGGARAQPVPSPSPIAIHRCGRMPQVISGPLINPNIDPTSIPYGIVLGIEYVNTSTRVAKSIDFAVSSADTYFAVRDVGKFSPGALIKHTFQQTIGQGAILPWILPPFVQCAATRVEYSDGTVWEPFAT